MTTDLTTVSMLVRREIEAQIAGPLIKAFIDEFGEERVLNVAKRVITCLAKQNGVMLASALGGNSIEHLTKVMALNRQGDALEFEALEQSADGVMIKVTQCRYAEMYRDLGILKLGYLLSCGRDFAMIEGFNPKITLTRTQTIMQGADFCDFRLKIQSE